MSARVWIGYDWFKLIVAVILALLLLVLSPSDRAVPAATQSPAIPTMAAPVANPPELLAPAPGAMVSPGNVVLSGRADRRSRVRVMIDNVAAGVATAADDGAWSLSVMLDPPGTYTIVVQTLDDQNNVAAASAPITLTTAEPQLAIVAPTLNPPAGSPVAGSLTLSGSGAPGSTIEVYVDGASIGTATVDANGAWSLATSLTEGTHAITVSALDATGQITATNDPIRLDIAAAIAIQTTPEPVTEATDVMAPSIDSPVDGAQLDAGTIILVGRGTPGSTIEILDGATVLGVVAVANDGTWSFRITPAADRAAYGVRPVGDETPVANPVRVTMKAADAPCANLAANCDAWVTRERGLRLRLRDTASLNGQILAMLPSGAQVALLQGPQTADGLTWWRVRAADGSEGWVAGEELRLQPD